MQGFCVTFGASFRWLGFVGEVEVTFFGGFFGAVGSRELKSDSRVPQFFLCARPCAPASVLPHLGI